jgi:hypothetical protein
MTIICKKGAQDFHRALSKVFDRVKSVALWSANIRKTAQEPYGLRKKINFMNNYSYGDLVIRKRLLTLNLFKLNEKNHDY